MERLFKPFQTKFTIYVVEYNEFFNLNSFIISCIDLTYENILYKACKDTNTTSIFYDYSWVIQDAI